MIAPAWRTSRHSNPGGACVEIAAVPDLPPAAHSIVLSGCHDPGCGEVIIRCTCGGLAVTGAEGVPLAEVNNIALLHIAGR